MQSNIICPQCRSEIPLEDVSVSTDIALCRHCGRNWSYAAFADTTGYFDPKNPPKGTWCEEPSPHKFEVGASTRSAQAFFLIPFTMFWSGITVGGIYGTQFSNRHFDLGTSLFGIPFILGTIILLSNIMMSTYGEVIVTVDGDDGVIFTGFRPIGWRRRFNWREVASIRRTEGHNRRSVYQQITFDGKKRLNFASSVNSERLNFMLGFLKKKWRESGHYPA